MAPLWAVLDAAESTSWWLCAATKGGGFTAAGSCIQGRKKNKGTAQQAGNQAGREACVAHNIQNKQAGELRPLLLCSLGMLDAGLEWLIMICILGQLGRGQNW